MMVYLSATFLLIGGVFFLAGTVGLLRFPDVYTRLHALTKADNVGFGMVVIGLSLQASSWMVVGQLLLTWLLIMFAGSSVAYLISSRALQRGVVPWKR